VSCHQDTGSHQYFSTVKRTLESADDRDCSTITRLDNHCKVKI
jgi:hypothetical protein